MASTNFIPNVTVIEASWLNDVNTVTYTGAVNAKLYGLSSVATAANNLNALKQAVAAVPVGGTLLIPAAASAYIIDTTGGLSNAVEINKRMEIVFQGDIAANFSAIQANPPYIFNVTSNDVAFTGAGGKISGDGTTNSVNTGTDQTFPGLVYVSGDNFVMTNCIIDTPPKVGVILYNCTGARITNNTFTGGPTTYGDTAYFAIRGYLGGQHVISNNTFTPDANGGMYVNAIFLNATNNCVIDSNVCIHPYEKLIYCVGSRNVISNNQVIGNSNDIPGVSPVKQGTLTSVYRMDGDHNVCVGNYSDYCAAGATVIGGRGNLIADNMFLRSGQLGIVAFQTSPTYGGTTISDTKISNNTLTFDSAMGFTFGSGAIQVSASQSAAENIVITDNSILGWTDTAGAAIYMIGTAAYKITNSKISGNLIESVVNGILVRYVERTAITDNVMDGISNVMIIQSNLCNENYIVGNYCGTATSILDSGYSTNSTYLNNQNTIAPLTGLVTLSAANATTVTQGGTRAQAKIFLQPANAAAATLVSSTKSPWVQISQPNFIIRTADATAAAGTEEFWYTIVQ